MRRAAHVAVFALGGLAALTVGYAAGLSLKAWLGL